MTSRRSIFDPIGGAVPTRGDPTQIGLPPSLKTAAAINAAGKQSDNATAAANAKFRQEPRFEVQVKQPLPEPDQEEQYSLEQYMKDVTSILGKNTSSVEPTSSEVDEFEATDEFLEQLARVPKTCQCCIRAKKQSSTEVRIHRMLQQAYYDKKEEDESNTRYV